MRDTSTKPNSSLSGIMKKKGLISIGKFAKVQDHAINDLADSGHLAGSLKILTSYLQYRWEARWPHG